MADVAMDDEGCCKLPEVIAESCFLVQAFRDK